MQFVLEKARLVRRYKRFLADVITESGEALCIHCPNTGAMLHCMSEGAEVWFSRSDNPKRKLPGTWEWVRTPFGHRACINTGRANALVEEALTAGVITELKGFDVLRREVRYGAEGSRIDFLLEFPEGPAYVEVKSVTLGFADSAVAAFPDAKTLRGAKHLRELAQLARQGVRAIQLYCVNLEGVSAVRPAKEIDPAYANALNDAKAAGVEVLAYGVTFDGANLTLTHALEVID